MEDRVITTALDLGTIDYCFVKHADFIEYEKFQISLTGRTTKKEKSFEIARYKIVRIVVEKANGRIIDLTLYNILHTLSLYFNFISISKIFGLGLAITFRENEVITGAKYFIMLIYSTSTFRYVDFLEKMTEAILEMLKKYMAEAKKLIEQRLISV